MENKVKILFFDTKPYDVEAFEKYTGQYNFEIKYIEEKLSEYTVYYTRGYDVVCVFVNDKINKGVIDILADNGVRLVALRCAGYNNLDVSAMQGRLRAVRVPDYSPRAVAEHTISLIMSLNRKVHKAYARTKEYNFSLKGLMGFDMYRKTAGVIGTGKIGRALCEILRGFGMRLLAFDLYQDNELEEDLGVKYVTLDELLVQSDIISLHCPLTKDTKYMINRDAVSKMKNGVMLVNTSRGQLIDTKALIEGLKEGKIGSAALDVYEEEEYYFFEDYSDYILKDDTLLELLALPNVLVTSHQGFFTKEAVDNIARTTLENIKAFAEGRELKNEVKI